MGSLMLRRELADAEWRARTMPAQTALRLASDLGGGLPVVTLEPLVAQLQSAPSAFVIGLPWLNSELLNRVGEDVIYLEQDVYLNDVDRDRYATGFAALPSKRQLLYSSDGWRVWRLGSRVESR